MLALSLGCPVLTSRLGSLQDLGELLGDDWLKLFDEPLDVHVLQEAVAWAQTHDRSASAPLAFADIKNVAAETAEFLRRIAREPASVHSTSDKAENGTGSTERNWGVGNHRLANAKFFPSLKTARTVRNRIAHATKPRLTCSQHRILL